jgi:dihydrofolate reductase
MMRGMRRPSGATATTSPKRLAEEERMSKVTSDISMSLDGFVTDLKASVGSPLERNDPGRLHDWMFDAKTEADARIVNERYASTGAVLIGKRMFDAGFEPWGDPPPFGMPVFVLTHEARAPQPMQGGTTYNFVTGIEAALEQARAAAGDKNVSIWGGANIIRQYLKAGFVDEIEIHLVPILLGPRRAPVRGSHFGVIRASKDQMHRDPGRDAPPLRGS